VSPSRIEERIFNGTVLQRRGRADSAPFAVRSYYLDPYTSGSIWKATLRDEVTYYGPTDPATASYRAINGNINTGADWNLGVWYTHTSDPTYPVVSASNSATVYMQVRVPLNFRIPGPAAPAERDGWVTIIEPDGKSAVDFYKMTAIADSSGNLLRFTVTRPPARTDLTGAGLVMNTTGISTTASTWGMRASTLSYPAGAIRKAELLAKKIDHALAISIPNAALKPGYIWPARAQDSNAATAYAGDTPMGTRLALPRATNVNSLGLASAEGVALATALLQRGGFVVDRSSTAVVTVERPVEVDDDYTEYKAALDRLKPDWQILTKLLVRVEGHTASLPGGPGAVTWPDAPEGIATPIP
jgi:hypothetical protein